MQNVRLALGVLNGTIPHHLIIVANCIKQIDPFMTIFDNVKGSIKRFAIKHDVGASFINRIKILTIQVRLY